ncbi:winged helix-turn-helix transcriptional regulator [Algicella marina]|nr:helix-turn-helix domain-containing protein [Algicella marina]
MVVLRDMMFGNKRSYGELLRDSPERISTNILAARLRHLEAHGLVSVADVPDHAQKRRYSLTEKAIALVPVMTALGAWGVRYLATDPAWTARSRFLAEGGAELEQAFMDELRHLHLSTPARGPSILARMDAVFEAEQAEAAANDDQLRTER